VPEVWFGLSDEQWQQLQESVEPLSGDGNHGVTLCVAALKVLPIFQDWDFLLFLPK